jgi:hypothetical protein
MDARAVYQAYLAYFGRPPDKSGLAAYTGASQASVITAFSASAESQALYAGGSVAEQVNAIYLNLFGRVAERAGAAYWSNEILSGRSTLAEMALAVLRGAQNEDALVVANKLQVMERFVEQFSTRGDVATSYVGDSAAAAARGFLSTVGSDANSLARALSAVPTAVESVASQRDLGKIGPKFSLSSTETPVVSFIARATAIVSSNTTKTAGLDDFLADTRFSSITGKGQTIAVLDSSFDLLHPVFGADADRNGMADRILYAADFTPERNGAQTRDAEDKHGTHVASLVASESPTAPGMAPGANLILLQVLTEKGTGSSNDIQQGLQWVIKNASLYNIVAVNMSLGQDNNLNVAGKTFYADEMAALVSLGIVPLVAAGNSYEKYEAQGVGSPASDPNALGVSASNNSTSALAAFSQRSSVLTDIVAPGQGILAASALGGTVALSGTSMATPIVSGAVALAQEIAQQTLGRRLTVSEVYSVLQSSASSFSDREIPSDGVKNSEAPFRHLNIKAMGEAVVALGGGTKTPTPSPSPSPGATPAPAPKDDFGDTLQTAGSISVGQSIAGSLTPAGDRDWFGVDLVAQKTYDIEITGGTLKDPYLRVFDAKGVSLAENDDRDDLDPGLAFVAPATGRYYVLVDSYLSSTTGTYTLDISAEQVSDQDDINEIDSDEIEGDEIEVKGKIDFGGDGDNFNLTLNAGMRYIFSLRGSDTGAGTLGDPFLELLQNGQVLASNDDGGAALDSELHFTPSNSGAYTLRASAISVDDVGSYTLQIDSEAVGEGSMDVPDAAGQTSLMSGASASGDIDFGGDEDWYSVDLEVGMEYSFSLDGLSDSYLTLYDGDGQVVATNDDGGDGENALLQFTPKSSGTYYIAASAYTDRETGEYVLSLSAETKTDDYLGNVYQAGSLSLGVSANGQLAQAYDFDFYTGTLDPGSYRVTVQPFGGADPLDDPYIYVDTDYDFSDAIWDDNGGSTGLDSSLSFAIAETTSTVIVVGGHDSGAYTVLIQAV